MDKIETPENEEILKFLNDLADYCIPMDGGKMRMRAQVWPIVKARDALLRADERQKAAEEFTEELLYELRHCNIQEPCEGCQQVGFWLTDKAAIAKVKAAIMAEPEEGTK